MKTNLNYTELSDNLLNKLSEKRLKTLKNKMNAIISKIDSDWDLTEAERVISKNKAIEYKNRIVTKLLNYIPYIYE